MYSPGLASMLPVLERMFKVKRRPLPRGAELDALAGFAGIEGAAVARIDGDADGQPFVLYLITKG
jgi:hypothetical protein